MAFLDFIQRLLGLQKPSATMAKERLQLVLAHDRSDLNPELLEQMRREILEVVQKYVEIDIEGGEVSLATEDRVTALVANLPIRRARPIPLSAPSPSPGPVESVEGQGLEGEGVSESGELSRVVATELSEPEPEPDSSGSPSESLVQEDGSDDPAEQPPDPHP
jgi:cell division topological specificity factor